MANDQDNQSLDGNLLAWSAARAARWPHLFSGLIDRYLELNNLSEADLCSLLRCDSATLNHLRLCGRPDPDPSAFALDLQRVADRFRLNAGTLASIVREVDAAEAFSKAGRNPSAGSLAQAIHVLPPEGPGTQDVPASTEAKGRIISPFSSTPGMLKAARDRDERTRAEDRGSDVGREAGDGGESEGRESEHQEGDDKGN